MSSLDNRNTTNVSRSNRTRGRIAEILSSARASLQEPSRPITPLTLDQRTSLSSQTFGNIPSIDPYASLQRKVSKKKSKENSLYSSGIGVSSSSETYYSAQSNRASLDQNCEQDSINYYNKISSQTQEFTHVNARYASMEYDEEEAEEDYASNNMPRSRTNSSDYDTSNTSSKRNTTSTNTAKESSTTSSSGKFSRISQMVEAAEEQLVDKRASSEAKLALIDFRDFMTKVDLELNTNMDMMEQEFLTTIMETKQHVESIIKKHRQHSKANTPSGLIYQDLFEVQTILWDVSTRIAELSIAMDLKQGFYCLLLKYCIHTFSLDEIATHQHSFNLRMMEYLIQAIYNLRLNQGGGQSLNDSFEGGISKLNLSSTVSSSMDNSNGNNSDLHAVVSWMDAVVECAHFTWSQMSKLLEVLQPPTSNNTTDRSVKIFSNAAVVFLFNIAAYATAILRNNSNDEIDRKRLLHVNIVDNVVIKCIKFYEKHPMVIDMMTAYNELKHLHISKLTPEDKKSLKQCNAALEKVMAPLIQSIGMIRNLALDKTGRTNLSNHHVTIRLCHLLTTYRNQAEVIVNIARVLAKLSLYDHVRSQISSHKKYIDALVSVIHHEAETCRKIMDAASSTDTGDKYDDDEDDAEDEEEELSWPAWHTWPVISRIAFTLGNLTTTNENNRHLIGQQLDGTSSILLLLQVCANSLSRINQQKQQQLLAKQAKAASNNKNNNMTSSIFNFANLSSNPSNPYVSLDDEDPTKTVEDTNEDEEQGYDIDHNAEIELRDAIIKLVRLLANISIDANVGTQVGSKHENLQILLELLLICDQSMEQEEMLLNVIAALTNLTFYTTQFIASNAQKELSSTETRQQQRLDKTLVTLSNHLSNSLFHENIEIVLECTRVLGNLTRRPAVIQSLMHHRIDEALLLILLQHSHTEIVSSVAGVIVNFSSHPEGRRQLLQIPALTSTGGRGNVAQNSIYYGGIVMKMSNMLRKLSMRDILIALLLSQILFNLLGSAEFTQHQRMLLEDVSVDKLILTLEEWMDLAQDMIAAENNADDAQYRQFVKIASSLVSVLHEKEKK